MHTKYLASTQYPGWIYDQHYGDYISPGGRTAPYPGAPFTGAVSNADFAAIKEYLKGDTTEQADEEPSEVVSVEGRLEFSITYNGDTINWIVVD